MFLPLGHVSSKKKLNVRDKKAVIYSYVHVYIEELLLNSKNYEKKMVLAKKKNFFIWGSPLKKKKKRHLSKQNTDVIINQENKERTKPSWETLIQINHKGFADIHFLKKLYLFLFFKYQSIHKILHCFFLYHFLQLYSHKKLCGCFF